ncbi:MAG: glycosyltransferase [Acidobacteria bacterium]|nr:glycosyltransferase [Acidobacteriota bacterium]
MHKILILIDCLSSLDGGAEKCLLRTSETLDRRHYEMQIVSFREPPERTHLQRFGCPVKVIHLRSCFGFEAMRAAIQLRGLIKREPISVVHTFFPTSDLWGGLVARLSGCRILISSRRDMGILRRRFHRILYRLLGGMFDQVQTVSSAVRAATIRDDHLDPERVIVIANGVPLQQVWAPQEKSQLRARYGFGGDSPLLVSIGSIKPVKGLDILVRAAARVCREFPTATFLILGRVAETVYFAQVQALIDELGLRGHFRFPGVAEDVFPMLRMCDVFCHLSRSEGFSNAVLEAMACGLPCVVSDAGGNPEAVSDGWNGFVVPREDADQAAARMIELLRSPKRALEMGTRGSEFVRRRFTTEGMVRQLTEQYDRLLAAKGM